MVHINAAVARLVGAFMVGKRIGYGKEAIAPHSLDADHGGCIPAVGGLVRLQRRLGFGSQWLRRPGLYQHAGGHGCCRAGLVPG